MSGISGTTVKEISVFLGTTLLLLTIPILNGYPLVFSDTGTYIRSAFEDFIPRDRPVWYGHFIHLTSFNGRTLWGVVIAQAVLCSAVILSIMRRMERFSTAPLRWPVVLVALVMLTGLSWYTGQLMPDIFSGIGILSMVLIITAPRGMRGLWWPFILLAAACAVHSSNLLIFTLLAWGAVLVSLRWAREQHFGAVRALAAVLLIWVLLPFADHLVTGGSGPGRGGHVFLMGRLVDAQVLPDHLDARCAEKNYAICAYRENFPGNSQQFLWDAESPLQLMGGWEATKDDYTAVIRDALTTPRFLWRFVSNSVQATGRQLVELHMGNGLLGTWYRTPDSPPYTEIQKHVPHELDAYRSSVQCGEEAMGRAVLQVADLLYRIGWALTMIAFGWLVFRWKEVQREWRAMIVLAGTAVVVNAAVCASLSVVADRFSTRMTWVLPLLIWPVWLSLSDRKTRPTEPPKPFDGKG